MGTDIHGIIRTYLPDHNKDEGAMRPWCTDEMSERTRNYRAFAVLANVRNGFGFAGVPTHEPIWPIAEPRGLPEEIETQIDDQGDIKTWPRGDTVWLGDHHHTHLWLSEILAYDWDQMFNECGVISREQFEAWSGEGPPEHGWSGSVDGGAVIKADQHGKRPEGWTHIRCYWQRSLRDACQPYPAYFEYLAVRHDPALTLLVLGFDS